VLERTVNFGALLVVVVMVSPFRVRRRWLVVRAF
jgi:hypothetical protein